MEVGATIPTDGSENMESEAVMGGCQASHSKQPGCVCCSIKSGFLVQHLCKYV